MGTDEIEGTERTVGMAATGQILFNKFEILQWLKKDEFAAVYRANHIYLGKAIILKVLDTHALPDEVTIQRFKREAKILARLEHPNIIRVLDFGVHEHFFYISFEFFESQSLRSVLKHRTLSTDEKKHILVQILQGLQYAHTNEVIHRDIKCENILVDHALQVKIADFGLALTSTESRTTNPQFLVGTPSYMSPEQILGQPITPQSDLFSLGIVAYEMYVGTHPFMGKDVNQSLNNIVSFDEDTLSASLSQVPEEMRSVISNLLRKNPRDRYRSAEEVLESLKVPSSVVQELQTRTGKRYVPVAVVVALVALVIGLLIVNNRVDKRDASIQNPPVLAGEQASQRTASDTVFRVSSTESPVKIPAKSAAGSLQHQATNSKRRLESDVPTNEKHLASNIPDDETIGALYIECRPWAFVNVNSVRVDTTPLRENIHLPAGVHTLELVHPGYPTYQQQVHISPLQTTIVKVNLDTLFGFLQVDAFPWGEVFINGVSYGVTPLQNPIKLIPGEYVVTLKNEQFGLVDKRTTVSRRDTAQVRHKFERF